MKPERCMVCMVAVGAIAVVLLAIVATVALLCWWERHQTRFARAITKKRADLGAKRQQLRAAASASRQRDSKKEFSAIGAEKAGQRT